MAILAETVFRTLTMEESRALLARNSVGRLAYAFHDRVDVEPIHYVMEGDWIYGRTSIGTKLATLAHHPWCALEADEVRGPFDWESVVLKGPFYLLDPQEGSPDVYDKALELVRTLVPESFSLGDPAPHRMALFRIHMSEVTGRAASRRRVT
jgi:nitroimidazol reductase NimA-like FMN-containing flavoprotein (pyridoxamine 5'-phosphate oxidase superfamily)